MLNYRVSILIVLDHSAFLLRELCDFKTVLTILYGKLWFFVGFKHFNLLHTGLSFHAFFLSENLLFCHDVYKVGDGGDALPLQARSRRHKCPGGAKKQRLYFSLSDEFRDISTQNRCRASAPRPARMDVLPLAVKDHHSAVVMIFKRNILLLEKLSQKLRSGKPEVTRKDKVVVIGCSSRVS